MEKVSYFEIKKGKLVVTLCSLGASVFSIYYDGELMTLGPKNKDDFENWHNYYGKTIGPVANRLENAKFVINGETYNLDKNEGENNLHSGINGYSNKNFDFESDDSKAVFTLNCKDMENGFPGNVTVKVTYEITDDNTLEIDFNASSDKDTLMRLTNHTFFNMGERSVEDLELRVNSSTYIDVRKSDLIPQKIAMCPDYLNFKSFKKISTVVDTPVLIENNKAKGVDHDFEFNIVGCHMPNVSFQGKKYRMTIYTNFSGVQVYTCNHETDFEVLSGGNSTFRAGAAIEPEDSLLSNKLLRKEDTYLRKIKYVFERL